VVPLETPQVSVSKLPEPSSIMNKKCGKWQSMSFSYSDYFHFTGKVNRGSTDHRPDLFIETKTASAGICGGIPTILNDHWTWVLKPAGTGKQESTSVRYWE
jgi:hypothetical protein